MLTRVAAPRVVTKRQPALMRAAIIVVQADLTLDAPVRWAAWPVADLGRKADKIIVALWQWHIADRQVTPAVSAACSTAQADVATWHITRWAVVR